MESTMVVAREREQKEREQAQKGQRELRAQLREQRIAQQAPAQAREAAEEQAGPSDRRLSIPRGSWAGDNFQSANEGSDFDEPKKAVGNSDDPESTEDGEGEAAGPVRPEADSPPRRGGAKGLRGKCKRGRGKLAWKGRGRGARRSGKGGSSSETGSESSKSEHTGADRGDDDAEVLDDGVRRDGAEGADEGPAAGAEEREEPLERAEVAEIEEPAERAEEAEGEAEGGGEGLGGAEEAQGAMAQAGGDEAPRGGGGRGVWNFDKVRAEDKFSGTGTMRVERFFEKVELLAQAEGWTDAERARRFPLCLAQKAYRFFRNTLTQEQKNDWAAMRAAFIAEFNTPEYERVRRQNFHLLKLRAGEDFDSFCERCVEAAEDAYPDNREEGNRQALERFIECMPSDVRVHLRLVSKPHDIDEATQQAKEFLLYAKGGPSEGRVGVARGDFPERPASRERRVHFEPRERSGDRVKTEARSPSPATNTFHSQMSREGHGQAPSGGHGGQGQWGWQRTQPERQPPAAQWDGGSRGWGQGGGQGGRGRQPSWSPRPQSYRGHWSPPLSQRGGPSATQGQGYGYGGRGGGGYRGGRGWAGRGGRGAYDGPRQSGGPVRCHKCNEPGHTAKGCAGGSSGRYYNANMVNQPRLDCSEPEGEKTGEDEVRAELLALQSRRPGQSRGRGGGRGGGSYESQESWRGGHGQEGQARVTSAALAIDGTEPHAHLGENFDLATLVKAFVGFVDDIECLGCGMCLLNFHPHLTEGIYLGCCNPDCEMIVCGICCLEKQQGMEICRRGTKLSLSSLSGGHGVDEVQEAWLGQTAPEASPHPGPPMPVLPTPPGMPVPPTQPAMWPPGLASVAQAAWLAAAMTQGSVPGGVQFIPAFAGGLGGVTGTGGGIPVPMGAVLAPLAPTTDQGKPAEPPSATGTTPKGEAEAKGEDGAKGDAKGGAAGEEPTVTVPELKERHTGSLVSLPSLKATKRTAQADGKTEPASGSETGAQRVREVDAVQHRPPVRYKPMSEEAVPWTTDALTATQQPTEEEVFGQSPSPSSPTSRLSPASKAAFRGLSLMHFLFIICVGGLALFPGAGGAVSKGHASPPGAGFRVSREFWDCSKTGTNGVPMVFPDREECEKVGKDMSAQERWYVKVFSKNRVSPRSEAWCCSREKRSQTTKEDMVWTKFLLTKTSASFPVPLAECWEMVRDGTWNKKKLVEVDIGIFSTNETVELEYKWYGIDVINTCTQHTLQKGYICFDGGDSLISSFGPIPKSALLSSHYVSPHHTIVWRSLIEPAASYNLEGTYEGLKSVEKGVVTVDIPALKATYRLGRRKRGKGLPATGAHETGQDVFIAFDRKFGEENARMRRCISSDAWMARCRREAREHPLKSLNPQLNFMAKTIERTWIHEIRQHFCGLEEGMRVVLVALAKMDPTLATRLVSGRYTLAVWAGDCMLVSECKAVKGEIVPDDDGECFVLDKVRLDDGTRAFKLPGSDEIVAEAEETHCSGKPKPIWKVGGNEYSDGDKAVEVRRLGMPIHSYEPSSLPFFDAIQLAQKRHPLALPTVGTSQLTVWRQRRQIDGMDLMTDWLGAQQTTSPDALSSFFRHVHDDPYFIGDELKERVGGATHYFSNGMTQLVTGILVHIFFIALGGLLFVASVKACVVHRKAIRKWIGEKWRELVAYLRRRRQGQRRRRRRPRRRRPPGTGHSDSDSDSDGPPPPPGPPPRLPTLAEENEDEESLPLHRLRSLSESRGPPKPPRLHASSDQDSRPDTEPEAEVKPGPSKPDTPILPQASVCAEGCAWPRRRRARTKWRMKAVKTTSRCAWPTAPKCAAGGSRDAERPKALQSAEVFSLIVFFFALWLICGSLLRSGMWGPIKREQQSGRNGAQGPNSPARGRKPYTLYQGSAALVSRPKALIEVKVGGVKLKALCDSGSDCQLITVRGLGLIDRLRRPRMEETDAAGLYGITGGHMDFLGQCEINLQVGGLTVPKINSFVVDAKFGTHDPYDLILGYDAFKHPSLRPFSLEPVEGWIQLGRERVPIVGGTADGRVRVRVAEDLTVPPRTAAVVSLHVPIRESEVLLWDVLNPTLEEQGATMPEAMIACSEGKSHGWIFNETDEPIKVRKGQAAGKALRQGNYAFGSLVGDDSVRKRSESRGLYRPPRMRSMGRSGAESEGQPLEAANVSQAANAVDIHPEVSLAEPHWTDPVPISPDLSPAYRDAFRRVIRKRAKAFSRHKEDLGTIKGFFQHIDVDGGPTRARVRQFSAREERILAEEIERLKRMDVIYECQSPFSASPVLVEKKDGSWRFTVSFILLNSRTKQYANTYPLPRIDSLLRKVAGMGSIGITDLTSGYFQCLLDEESQKCTAFEALGKKYCFRRMAQGLCGSGWAFQAAMSRIEKDAGPGCMAYQDDFLVCGIDHDEGIRRWDRFLAALIKHGAKCRMDKSLVGATEVVWLGMKVSGKNSTIALDEKRVGVVDRFVEPKTIKQIRSFAGLIEYMSPFIDRCSEKLEVLMRLTRKGAKFEFGPEQKAAFAQLKADVKAAGTLAICPEDETGPLTLRCYTDASRVAIGGSLVKVLGDGSERIIAMFSRKLKPHEAEKWAIIELEALSIYYACFKNRSIIHGVKTTVLTDHKPLAEGGFLRSEVANPRLKRMRQELNHNFPDLEIKWVPANTKSHKVADMLSRLYEDSSIEDATYEGRPPKEERMIEVLVSTRSQSRRAAAAPSGGGEERRPGDGKGTRVAPQEAGPRGPEWTPPLLDTSPREWAANEARLRVAQRRCEQTYRLLQRVVQNPEECGNMLVDNGVLYWKSGARVVPYVPEAWRPSILRFYHDSLAGGHCEARRLESKIAKRAFWEGLGASCRSWCEGCALCQAINSPHKRIRAPMRPLNLDGSQTRRFAWYSLDVLGMYKPCQKTGAKWVLSVFDQVTKNIFWFPMKTATASEVIEVLFERLFAFVGVCEGLTSDSGTQFTGRLAEEFSRTMEAPWLRSFPHHQSANGASERSTQTAIRIISAASLLPDRFRSQLAAFTNVHTEWSRFLNVALLAYRSSDHESTQRSPIELSIGKIARLPGDSILETRMSRADEPTTLEDLLKTFLASEEEAVARIREVQRKRKEAWDKDVYQPLKVGDRVRRRRLGAKVGKMTPQWIGPYRILAFWHERNRALLQDLLHPTNKPKYISLTQLKRTNELFPGMLRAGKNPLPHRRGTPEATRRSTRLQRARASVNKWYYTALENIRCRAEGDLGWAQDSEDEDEFLSA